MAEIVKHESTAIVATTADTASRNPALVYLASLAPSSQRPMRQSLTIIAYILGVAPVYSEEDGKEITCQVVPWGALCYSVKLDDGKTEIHNLTPMIRNRLGEKYSAATANRHLSALRGVLKDTWRLGYMSAEDYQRSIDLKPIKGSKVSQAEAGRHLDSGEIKGLMDACYDGTKAGLRDAAIIAVGYGCGLRRSEIANLDLADYDTDKEALLIRAGKGNKQRVAYLPGGANEALRAWLLIRGDASGPLFYSARRGDNIESKGLTDQAIYNILASRAALGGVAHFTPHDLRRTFAGDLLDAGEDISTVQKMMGHSNANTTAGYDRRDAKSKKKAASKLHVPYRGQLF